MTFATPVLAGEAVFALTTRLEYLEATQSPAGKRQRWAVRGPLASIVSWSRGASNTNARATAPSHIPAHYEVAN